MRPQIHLMTQDCLFPSTTQEHLFPSTLVLCIDRAKEEATKREDRCQKFINQDLDFLTNKAPNNKPKLNQINLPQRDHRDKSQPTQSVELVLGFTPQECQEVQDNSDINVEDLLQTKLCTDYIKTPIQMLDGIHVNQPKRFLPLAKEALKIAEALHKEQQVVQWAGLPLQKLV